MLADTYFGSLRSGINHGEVYLLAITNNMHHQCAKVLYAFICCKICMQLWGF